MAKTVSLRRLTAQAVLMALAAVLVGILAVGCGSASSADSSTGADVATPPPAPPMWRYVNSGWVSPVEYLESEADPYLKELRVFVITNQEQLDDYNEGFVTKKVSGNPTTLGRIDFEHSIVLAAYYVWQPVQGDPLSVVGLEVTGPSAVVQLELSEDPQGHEYPYLFAPMTMVAVERGLFPLEEAVDFTFKLNGEPDQIVMAVANGTSEDEECGC